MEDNQEKKSYIIKLEDGAPAPTTEPPEDKIKPKVGRTPKPQKAGKGTLRAQMERSIERVLKLREKKILNNREIEDRLRGILDRCLDLMEQHFDAIDISHVEIVETNTGKGVTKVMAAGFPIEDYNAIQGAIALISNILNGDEKVPAQSTDQRKLIKEYLRPLSENANK